MTNYRTHFNTRKTPQNQSMGRANVKNRAGGFVYGIDKWGQLDRFLILGTDQPTYYASAKEMTIENAQSALDCIKEDGIRVVNKVVEISDEGRAPSNDPALYILAMCAGEGDEQTRKYALKALPKVARIGTHLFHFINYVEGFRGWGRGLKKAIADWYNCKSIDALAYQIVKYQRRDGWSHRDLLRLAHPKAKNNKYEAIYRWIVGGSDALKGRVVKRGEIEKKYKAVTRYLHKTIKGFEALKKAKTEQEVILCIKEYNLPWETIPRDWLKSKKVWKTLLPKLPMTATLRNLGRLTANETLKPLSSELSMVVDRLGDEEAIVKARIHPLAVLKALHTYSRGQGDRGSLSWNPISRIVDALDSMFYIAFKAVEPTNKNMMLAIDVSGSMSSPIMNMSNISAREASAAMALVTAATEKNYMIMGFSHRFEPLNISPTMRLDSVVKEIYNWNFGATDCSLPMRYAQHKELKVDGFVVYTDNETWYGDMHPTQALVEYRKKSGINAKLVVVAMTSTGYSIADPNDGGMLDVVGFDVAAPNIISDFIR